MQELGVDRLQMGGDRVLQREPVALERLGDPCERDASERSATTWYSRRTSASECAGGRPRSRSLARLLAGLAFIPSPSPRQVELLSHNAW